MTPVRPQASRVANQWYVGDRKDLPISARSPKSPKERPSARPSWSLTVCACERCVRSVFDSAEFASRRPHRRHPCVHPLGVEECSRHAPDVQGTASDVVEGEGIPATAEQEGQAQRSGVRNTADLNDSPDLLLPGEYSVVGAGRAAGIQDLQPRCALALAASVGQQCRPARRAFWPQVVAIANPSHSGPPAPD